jgi:hypothetical protein
MMARLATTPQTLRTAIGAGIEEEIDACRFVSALLDALGRYRPLRRKAIW